MKVFISLVFALLFLTKAKAQIVINEIFPDPSPSVQLPEAEYIELFNTTATTIQLENWSVADPSNTATFLTDQEISAGDFLIITDEDDVALFSAYENVIGLSNFPSLNNSGDQLTLLNDASEIVEIIQYENSWYKDALKEDGGWSLERINPFTNCGGENNWTASNNSNGGSPTEENAVFDSEFVDESELQLTTIWLTESQELEITFSKNVNVNMATELSTYTISPALPIQNIWVESGNSIKMQFSEALDDNQRYEITIQQLSDCEGISQLSATALFGIPQQATQGDLRINEILFNPASGGVDFIEIVNTSNLLFSFDDLSILEINPITPSVVDDYVQIDNTKQYIFPDSLYVLTTDPSTIIQQYEVENPHLLLNISIPNYDDIEGIVSIVNEELDTIDQLHYYENWHFEGLSDVNGVSLERLDLSEQTQNENNWYSASYTVGYGTPTSENSQQPNPATTSNDELILSHKAFTPDNDGMDDFLEIQLLVNNQEVSATIAAYSVRGYLVKTIVNNQLIDQTNIFRWTGLDDNDKALPIGYYIIVANYYDSEGNQKQLHKKVVLSRRQ